MNNITKETCLSEVKRIYKKYGKVTAKLIDKYGKISNDSVKNKCGSLLNAYKEAGIELKSGQRKLISREEITKEIYRIFKIYGYVSKPLIEKHSSYSPKVITRIFGSFKNMYSELNINRSNNGIIPSNNDLFNEAKRIFKEYGFLSYELIAKYGNISTTCFKDRAKKNKWNGINYYRQKINCPIPTLGWTESASAKYAINKFSNYLNEKPIKEKTFDWLINPYDNYKLRIDAYYEKANVAIEYNGPQHYYVDNFYTKNKEALIKRQSLDSLKYKKIREHGIHLIIIHFLDKINLNYIQNSLSK